jgi:2-aminoethylphosphonate transport system ATP-binding protein
MRDGKLVAYGDTQGLYRHPPNRFAAEFLGRANVLPAQQLEPTAADFARVRYADGFISGRNPHGIAAGSACYVCMRPHDLHFEPRSQDANRVTGIVRSVQWLGELHDVVLDVGGETVRLTRAPLARPPEPGTALSVHFDAADVTLVPEGEVHG